MQKKLLTSKLFAISEWHTQSHWANDESKSTYPFSCSSSSILFHLWWELSKLHANWKTSQLVVRRRRVGGCSRTMLRTSIQWDWKYNHMRLLRIAFFTHFKWKWDYIKGLQFQVTGLHFKIVFFFKEKCVMVLFCFSCNI